MLPLVYYTLNIKLVHCRHSDACHKYATKVFNALSTTDQFVIRDRTASLETKSIKCIWGIWLRQMITDSKDWQSINNTQPSVRRYLHVLYLWQRCNGIERISSRDITINRLRRRSVGCRRTRRPVTGLPSSNTEMTSIMYGSISRRPLLIAFRTRPLSVTSNQCQHDDGTRKVILSSNVPLTIKYYKMTVLTPVCATNKYKCNLDQGLAYTAA